MDTRMWPLIRALSRVPSQCCWRGLAKHTVQLRSVHGTAKDGGRHRHARDRKALKKRPHRPTSNRAGGNIDVSFYEEYMDERHRRDEADLRRENQIDARTHATQSTKTRKPKKVSVPAAASAVVKDKGIPPLEKFDLFASCLPGLEPVLYNELLSLGFSPESSMTPKVKTGKSDADQRGDKTAAEGGIKFRVSSVEAIMKCHLFLGSASHILLRCGKPFQARGMEELRRKVSKMSFWEQYLPRDLKNKRPRLDIRVTASKSRLNHTVGIAERVERGILEALGFGGGDGDCVQNQTAMNQSDGDTSAAIKLAVRVHRDYVQLSVDTSDVPLHRRGYRLEMAKAPLREDLAYALLYSAGWNCLRPVIGESYSPPALLDPFCGSGTIAIEGAAMISGLPPGRLLSAPLRGSQFENRGAWGRLISQAEANAQPDGFRIFGSDRDNGAINASISNAERAGVSELCKFERHAIRSTPWLNDPLTAPLRLLVATNPPFGVRLQSTRKSRPGIDPLLPLYQTLGHLVRGLNNKAQVAILAHDIGLARKTELKDLKVAFNTKHGGLPVVAMTTGEGNIAS